MYILTQDKTKLLEFERIEVVKSFGTYYLHAWGRESSSLTIIGEYKSEEQAKTEFQHIINALNN